MYVSCPVCETRIDYETVGANDKSIYCPSCKSDVSIEGLITSRLVSKFDDSPTRTMTIDLSNDIAIKPGGFIGKFEILEIVGEGGFGSVYKARDHELDRIVALKVPKGSDASEINAELFLREAQLAASVRDSNIVAVHEIGRDGDTSFICSEFIDGDTLKAWTRENHPSIIDCCNLIIRIAKSLQKAHDAELIHRDLKPANILMDSEGTPYITDFGLAKRIATDEIGNVLASKTASENRREIVGTPAYMSPEQAIGDLSLINRRTDLYSLGVILYELVVGKRPFNGSSATLIQDVIYQNAVEPAKANENVPKVLSAIIKKAMSKNQHERFDSASEFAEELQRFVAGKPTITSPLTVTENILYQASKHRLIVAASVVVVLAVCITAVISPLGAEQNAAAPFVIPPAKKIPLARVTITTKPARATIAVIPLHPVYRTPILDEIIQPSEQTPVVVDLPAGDFIVEAYIPGMKDGGVHEVRRTVAPAFAMRGQTTQFRTIVLKDIEMSNISSVSGGAVDVPQTTPDGVSPYEYETRDITPFYIQQTEVTCKQYSDVMGKLPSLLTQSKDPIANADYPVTLFELEDALEFAERIGMRLMEFDEYYFLVTNGCRIEAVKDAIRDGVNCWEINPVKSCDVDLIDGKLVSKEIYGLFSNVAEATGSTRISERIVAQGLQALLSKSNIVAGAPMKYFDGKGAPLSTLHFGKFKQEDVSGRSLSDPYIGFRCVKSHFPRFIKRDE